MINTKLSPPITSAKNIFLVCCTLNAIFLGRCSVLPLLKPFADNLDPNLQNSEQTLLFAIFYVTMGMSAFGLQRLAEHCSCRSIITFSSFGMGAAFLFQALSPNFWILVMARCSTGLFAGLQPVVVTYLRQAASFNENPQEKEQFYNESLGFWIGAAFAIGPIFNIGLVAIGESISQSKVGGYMTAFYFASAMNFLMGFLCLAFLASDQNQVTNESQESTEHPKISTTSKWKIWVVLICNFTIEVGYSAVASLLPQFHDPRTDRGGFSLESESISIMLSAFGLGAALSTPICRRINWNTLSKLVMGNLIMLLGVFLHVLITLYNGKNLIVETTLVALVSLLSGFGIGVFYTYSFVEILDRCPGKDSRFYTSAMICICCMGNLSATGLGALADGTSVMSALFACAGILFIGTSLVGAAKYWSLNDTDDFTNSSKVKVTG